jgi:hypothetical protein
MLYRRLVAEKLPARTLRPCTWDQQSILLANLTFKKLGLSPTVASLGLALYVLGCK